MPPSATRAATSMLWIVSGCPGGVQRVRRHHDRTIRMSSERWHMSLAYVRRQSQFSGMGWVHRGVRGALADQHLIPLGVVVAPGPARDHARENLDEGVRRLGRRQQVHDLSGAVMVGAVHRRRPQPEVAEMGGAAQDLLPLPAHRLDRAGQAAGWTFSIAPMISEARAPLPANGFRWSLRPCQ